MGRDLTSTATGKLEEEEKLKEKMLELYLHALRSFLSICGRYYKAQQVPKMSDSKPSKAFIQKQPRRNRILLLNKMLSSTAQCYFSRISTTQSQPPTQTRNAVTSRTPKTQEQETLLNKL